MKIVGIVLIKNEDLYIEKVLLSIVDFCDSIIVLDNYSSDNTWSKVQDLSVKFPKIFCEQIKDSLTSHSYIEKYAGTDTWLFGVDGDEIYDSGRLVDFRRKLLAGEYKEWWSIRGNCLHVTELDLAQKKATGYMSPPARSITKLFNFSLLSSWYEERSERLHGDNLVFNKLFNPETKYLDLHEKYKWEDSFFRCLHLCFLDRSSVSKGEIRLNPTEASKFWFMVVNFFRNLKRGRFTTGSAYKLDKYKVGPKVDLSITNCWSL